MKPIVVLRHQPHIAIGMVAEFIEEAGADWEYLDLFEGIPADFEVASVPGLVVLGGAMSANNTDDYPFLRWDLVQIERALKHDVPIFGICLGSQLLARALGAAVTVNPVRELGWYELTLRPEASDDRLFTGCEKKQTVCQFHGDTFALPDGAVHLAETPACANQAFRYGETAWGFQFHIEMTVEMCTEWLARRETTELIDSLDYLDRPAIEAATPEGFRQMRPLTQTLAGRFAQLCMERVV
ncbi:MAG: type 1 glutamine amidotransferase [Planctomycetia bacterium]|jgi:GMP synthase (glutamine-hydrolysing)